MQLEGEGEVHAFIQYRLRVARDATAVRGSVAEEFEEDHIADILEVKQRVNAVDVESICKIKITFKVILPEDCEDETISFFHNMNPIVSD